MYNKRLAAATGGKYELCGHYNMYNGKFLEDDDGLTVVSNLFLFPFVKAFQRGVRSPHSSIVLLPGNDRNSVRAFHLSGRAENIKVITTATRIALIKKTDLKGLKNGAKIKYIMHGTTVSFKADPYSMYEMFLNDSER